MNEKEAQEKAFDYYKQAAGQGLDISQYYALAECYAKGIGCEKNKEKAKELYKKAAVQGNEEAKEKMKEFSKSRGKGNGEVNKT